MLGMIENRRFNLNGSESLKDIILEIRIALKI